MLVLKRRSGQWVEITVNEETLKEVLNRGGEAKLRFRVYNIVGKEEGTPRVDIAFEDQDRIYEIQRPERVLKKASVSNGLL
jgi:hypothetical protein